MGLEFKYLKPVRKIFGDNLRRIRSGKGLTQAQMAEYLSIPHNSYHALENGHLPQRKRLQVLIDKLGVSEADLYKEEIEMAPVLSPTVEMAIAAAIHDATDRAVEGITGLSKHLTPAQRRLISLISGMQDYQVAELTRWANSYLEGVAEGERISKTKSKKARAG